MNKKGFTLVELLAVIAILAILVIIALPNVLKMFNDAKKNSFLTEAKTVYSEVSKKYISESMKGNKLTYVSSEDDTKLEMTGRDLQYCVLLNTDGSVSSMKVSNGEWVAELPSGKKITDLKSTDLKDGNLDDYDCTHPFKYDSWETISKAVKSGNTGNYHVGDEKEVNVGKYGTHKVRIANMSTPNECNDDKFSQSACGFVVEFADVIDTRAMNSTITNVGGWRDSDMRTYLNNDIYNLLENDLKKVISETLVVSGHGSTSGEKDFITEDYLYLLSAAEVWKGGISNDSARNYTKQLDYYEGVTTESGKYSKAIKNNNAGSASLWWLRSAHSGNAIAFFNVAKHGNWNGSNADKTYGVSPAFRIE